MADRFQPETEDQLVELIRWAVAETVPLALHGSGSKAGLGRPVDAEQRLDLNRLTGITLYEPEELVMTVAAGTPLAEVEAALAAAGQRLTFEPPDYSALLGVGDRGTIGGVFACNLSGPRRPQAGAARDFLLGVRVVTGRGEAIKSGGRVVKNVTGYDLSKLFTGSYGTLGAITELSFKTLPTPADAATLLITDVDSATGLAILRQASGSAHDPSGLAYLPGPAAARSDVVDRGGQGVAAIRLEGPAPSIDYRGEQLRNAFGAFGTVTRLDREAAGTLWRQVRDVAPLLPGGDQLVWRLSVPPTAAEGLAAGLDGEMLFDWAGGLIWLATSPSPDAGAAAVRQAIAECGGHATLMRAPEALRREVPVFQPQPPSLAALTARVKDGFDPNRVLNPGRMYRDL